MTRLLALLCLLLAFPAHATPVVADLSSYRIDIDSSFTGTRLFLFGARNDNGDVVVVVRGPLKNFMLRRKEQIAGVWINRDRMKLYNIPDYYVVATSKPLSEIEEDALFARLGIGEGRLVPPPTDPELRGNFAEFSKAFFDYQRRRKLYLSEPGSVQFMGETLFKTVVDFPDKIPDGDYTAEIYLLSDGEIVGMQSTPIKVVKSGLDAFLHMYAHRHPALYGLTAVVLALGCGWFAGRVFERS